MYNKDAYGYVYITTNTNNGMQYIGQHSSKEFHPWYKGSGKYISRDIKNFGASVFKVNFIEWCYSEEELNEREKYWIAYHKAYTNQKFYNVTPDGKGGHTFTDETREQIGQTLRARTAYLYEHVEDMDFILHDVYLLYPAFQKLKPTHKWRLIEQIASELKKQQ